MPRISPHVCRGFCPPATITCTEAFAQHPSSHHPGQAVPRCHNDSMVCGQGARDTSRTVSAKRQQNRFLKGKLLQASATWPPRRRHGRVALLSSPVSPPSPSSSPQATGAASPALHRGAADALPAGCATVSSRACSVMARRTTDEANLQRASTRVRGRAGGVTTAWSSRRWCPA